MAKSRLDNLTSDFISALHGDWLINGSAVLEKVREKSPAKYAALVAQLVPQQHEVSVDTDFEDCNTHADFARRLLIDSGADEWHDQHRYEFGLIAPPIRTLTLSRGAAEIVLGNGTSQTIAIHWQNITGMCAGSQRPMFVCGCGPNVFKLYRLHGTYQCKRCAVKRGAVYACQHGDGSARARLQAARLRQFLGGIPDD